MSTKRADPPADIVDAAWQLLAEMAGKQHWHGGPDPCPVCGGTPSPRRERQIDARARIKARLDTPRSAAPQLRLVDDPDLEEF